MVCKSDGLLLCRKTYLYIAIMAPAEGFGKAISDIGLPKAGMAFYRNNMPLAENASRPVGIHVSIPIYHSNSQRPMEDMTCQC